MNQNKKEESQGHEILLSRLESSPVEPLSSSEAKAARADIDALARDRPRLAAAVAKGSVLRDFLAAVFSLSPFLADAARVRPQVLEEACCDDIAAHLDRLIEDARNAWKPDEADGDKAQTAEAAVMTRLRLIKRDAAFLIALADLARLAPARETTRRLSALAEACLAAAVDHLLLSAHEAGKMRLSDPGRPSAHSGLFVLGMGKLGAGELNYSSDVDVVVFFDPAAGTVEPLEATDTFARMARRLVRIMQERTGDGYVFRTDLRLRPDPGSTPLAVSVDAALTYYEGRGQNWERAAFIKARPVAGDIEAGEAFLKELRPFVFRKYLDYAAIADIHSIKRQIHAHKGHDAIAVAGHDVKLGRGGIREIEFFVQTQQLIAGGRMPALRTRRTDAALDELLAANWVNASTAESLKQAYWTLRDVEHRVQMVDDEQTHTLPEDDDGLKRIARMAGFKTAAAFSKNLVETLKTVESHYGDLFEQESKLSTGTGNLVFTGEGDDPSTLETLKALGFERPGDISRVIRTWHYGRYRATRSVEARERLTELTPRLLEVFGGTRRADEALLRFDAFLSGLPAGIQLFSLLGTNPGLLSLLVTIMASAPRLADLIARKPHIFDGMLDPALLDDVPTRDYLARRIDAFAGGNFAYEEVLDRLRIVASEQKFLIGMRLLTGRLSGPDAGPVFADLADLVVAAALDAVTAEMERAHGRIAGGRTAVVGLGKLGSRELTAGSDLDIILLYDHDPGFGESDGGKPLDPVRYYTRLTQRLMAALSSPTAEGVLYEVDLRLRPSGNKGPVATSITAFAKYQRSEAWTWEHMALSRARVAAGDETLAGEAESVFSEILVRPRDRAAVAADVGDMRRILDEEKPPTSAWDVKLMPGGLIDIEFIAQYLALAAAKDAVSARQTSATRDTLAALAPGELDPDELAVLGGALDLYQGFSQIVRLCLDGDFDAEEAPSGLFDLLCRSLGFDEPSGLRGELEKSGEAIRAIFLSIVGAGGQGKSRSQE